MNIYVNEIFGPTIQGEGKSIGKEVIFIRLAGCNLQCVWCDTPYTWKYSEHDKSKEVSLITVSEALFTVLNLENWNKLIKAVVISGGEPLLQQKALTQLVAQFKLLDYWVEVETNGTIVPNDELTRLIDQFNCSPKLFNSGNSLQKRLKPEVLKALEYSGKANFKFVYSDEVSGLEIKELVKNLGLNNIYVMPEGRTLDELKAKEEEVKAFCAKNNFIYSKRLHIEVFGARRAV